MCSPFECDDWIVTGFVSPTSSSAPNTSFRLFELCG